MDIGENKTFTQAYIKEEQARTSGYKIQYFDGTSWVDAYTGTTIGTAGTTVTFSAVTGSRARLLITATSGWPSIREFQINK